MNAPVDDFARGPEVKFGHENDRWEIRKEGVVIPMDEILSVLKPFAEHYNKARSWALYEEYRHAHDLYLKLGGTLE